MKILAKPAFKNLKDNPYNFLLYNNLQKIKQQNITIEEFSTKKALFNKFDIFHIHWPEYHTSLYSTLQAYIKSLSLIIIIILLKIKNTKIVWTFHNAKPHDSRHKFLEKIFYLIFSSLVDGIIYMSRTSRDISYLYYPQLKNKPNIITLHGTYTQHYPNNIDQKTAKKTLGIDDCKKVILCFGQIRPYKGIHEIINAFKISANDNIVLLIVGKASDKTYFTELKEISANHKNIILTNSFVKDEDIQVYLNASDLIISNYTEILNSGVAILALSFSKDILIPESPQMQELKEELQTKKIHLFNKPITKEIMELALSTTVETTDNGNYRLLDWQNIANKTYAFYERLIFNN